MGKRLSVSYLCTISLLLVDPVYKSHVHIWMWCWILFLFLFLLCILLLLIIQYSFDEVTHICLWWLISLEHSFIMLFSTVCRYYILRFFVMLRQDFWLCIVCPCVRAGMCTHVTVLLHKAVQFNFRPYRLEWFAFMPKYQNIVMQIYASFYYSRAVISDLKVSTM